MSVTDDSASSVSTRPGEAAASRRRWRRVNSAGKRTHRVEIKLSDEEYARVRAAAEVQRCSLPAVFTRAIAADGSVAALKYQLLRDDLGSARRLMVQVSNNLNQAVRLAHVHELDGSPSPRRFEQDLRAVTTRLDEVIGQVGRIVDAAEAVAGKETR